MKYYIYTVLLLLLTTSCSDDVQKWDQWPEWKLASPLSVGGQVLDEEIYSNFQGKKLHLEKGQEVEFSGIDEIESILSPDMCPKIRPVSKERRLIIVCFMILLMSFCT